MGLFDVFRRPSAAMDGVVRDASDDRYFEVGGRRSEIDVAVSVERARKVPVVRDCLQVLAESVAGLERAVRRRRGDGQVETVENHPIAQLLDDPNARMTGFDLVYAIVDDLEAWGDFYGELRYPERGAFPEQIIRLDPARVVVEETFDESKRFRVRDRRGRERVLVEGEVWHIPRPPLVDNLKGTSPILDDGREAIAVAIALQRYANVLFTNDATPPYALSMDGHFNSQDDKRNFLDAWRRWVTGRNRHQPGILEYGIEPKRMGLTAEEAQFLETRKELWLDLTRIWRVPPHKVAILDRATFSNIEHQSLEFVMDTLRPILELIEASIDKHLIGDGEHFFEFNVESLLRGDIKTRYEAYALGRQWGWLSVNDVLRMERRNG
ncbi:MAG: phage portal protein, partial [Roseicyclus sp.]